MIGSAGQSRIADRIGRRVTLLRALWISGVRALATALFATSFTLFCLLRVLTGPGLGVLFPLVTN